LGRRARRADPARSRGHRVPARRQRCRRAARRRHRDACAVSRRLRRRPERDPQGRRHRVPGMGRVGQLAGRHRRDARAARARHPSRRQGHQRHRQARRRRRPHPRRGARTRLLPRRADPAGSQRRADRCLGDGLRRAQPGVDLPVHRCRAAGGVVPRPAGVARRRRSTRALADWRARAEHRLAGRDEPRLETGAGRKENNAGRPARHLSRGKTPDRRASVAQHVWRRRR